ncbi:FGGY-family carbohydrate kinase [Baaleninema sp.]|uniref:FGGY-family carbohydrate kinase n=1 Tax=Baaleninema sp. TaxID=3101197 RepID=UPI003D087AA5
MTFYLGIDFGTSGARAIAIDAEKTIAADARIDFTAQTCDTWREGLWELLDRIPLEIRQNLRSIALNGTSATVFLCDERGNPITEPLLYHDNRGKAVAAEVRSIAPANHPALSATSGLSKLIWFRRHLNPSPSTYFLHQADWLSFLLHGKLGISDYHNTLKLGYDPEICQYPQWLNFPAPKLPRVVEPGTAIDLITSNISRRFRISPNCRVCAGTTDSIAAFLASGASSPGEAVTSLGSTLVLKLLSTTRIDAAPYGIYSHRLGNLWLAGGASNTGGAVLKQFFSEAELQHLSDRIPTSESPLDYYPLCEPGERFPVSDPQYPPRLEPKPEDSVAFLHGLLDSMARIEARGYGLLQELGASRLTRVYTAGGGAKNPAWTRLRQHRLGVPVTVSAQTEAAYGTAMLASS